MNRRAIESSVRAPHKISVGPLQWGSRSRCHSASPKPSLFGSFPIRKHQEAVGRIMGRLIRRLSAHYWEVLHCNGARLWDPGSAPASFLREIGAPSLMVWVL